MRITQLWRTTGRTLARERDERSELAVLRATRDAVVALVVAVAGYIIPVLAIPMSDETRSYWLAALPVVMLVSGGITFQVSAARRRAFSPEHREAEAIRAMLLWAPYAAVTSAAVLYAAFRSFAYALVTASLVLVLQELVYGLRLVRARRHAADH